MKKRGLSNVIATILIILIVIVAVAIVWSIIRGIIKKNTEQITLSKFTIDLKIESIRVNNDSLNIKVKRNPGEGDLKGITFILFDGENTHIFEKMESLEQLSSKTFVLNYRGPLVKVSIAPIFMTNSGKLVTGNIVDVYYFNLYLNGTTMQGGNTGGENCTPDCGTRQCGPVPNGCGTSCGSCPPESPNCENGICTSNPCTANCSCAEETCLGQVCVGGCGEACPGELTLQEDCGGVYCGASPHGCGFCGECETGYHCDGGICVASCVPDCGTRNCGPVPNGCGESCGYCNESAGEWCDEGYCSSGPCEPNCGTRNCGPVPNGCGESCGYCNESAGEYCYDGMCVSETFINNGTVYSVWPINVGIYFDSENLPKENEDYTDLYVKFKTGRETRCLQIREFVVPVVPQIYNMSYIRFVTSSTSVSPGDTYEIWRTYTGCTR